MKLRWKSLWPALAFIADPGSIFASHKMERPLKMYPYRRRLALASDGRFLF
jgi:hypothetical protein